MKIFYSILGIFFVFLILSIPTTFVTRPVNPAMVELQAQKKPLDLVFIGDSRVHSNFSPTKIVESLQAKGIGGINSFNFGVDGTDVVHHFSFVTNGLLKQNHIPGLVVWQINPLQYNGKRLNNRHEQLQFSDVGPLWRAGAPLEFLLDLITMRVFPPWKYHSTIKTIISDYLERAGIRTLPFQQKILGLSYKPLVMERKYSILPDGQETFIVLEWADRFQRSAQDYKNQYVELKLDDWQFNLARQIATRVRLAGARLLLVETPVSPWFREHLEVNPKHGAWRQRMSQIAAEEGAFFWNHAHFYAELEDRRFGDPGHLPHDLALDYSAQFADLLVQDPIMREALTSAARAAHESAHAF